MSCEAVLDRLFTAALEGDSAGVRSCFSPAARIWHGYDCIAHDLDSFITMLEAYLAAGNVLRYDDVRRIRADDGMVQHHLLVTPNPAGGWLAQPCCSVFHFKDGVIDRVEEYVDRTGKFQVDSLPAVTPGI